MDPFTGENPYDRFLPTEPPPAPADPPVEDFDRFLPSDPPSTIGRARTALASVERGAGEATGNVLKFLARAGQAIGRVGTPISPGLAPIVLPDAVTQERNRQISPARAELMVEGDPLYRAGQVVDEANKDFWKANPKFEREFLSGLIPNTLGRMVPAIATGNPYAAIFVGSADQAESAADEAIKAGRPDLADRTAALNFPVALASEAVLGVPGRILGRMRGPGETLGKQLIGGFVREGSQEGIEQVWQNFVAKHLAPYDPNRGYMDQVPESMLVGGIVGGGLSGLSHISQPKPEVIDGRVIQPSPNGADAAPTPKSLEYRMPWVDVQDYVEPINVNPVGARTQQSTAQPNVPAQPDIIDGQVVPEDWQRQIERGVAPTPRLSPALETILRQHAIIESTPHPVKRPAMDIPILERPPLTIQDPEDEQPRLKFPITGSEMEFRSFPRINLGNERLMIPETTSEPKPEVYDPAASMKELLERIDRTNSRRARVALAAEGTTLPSSGVPISVSKSGIIVDNNLNPGETLRYGMPTRLPRRGPVNEPLTQVQQPEPEPAPVAPPAKKVSAARAAIAPSTPANSPSTVKKSRARAAITADEVPATAPAPAPTPGAEPQAPAAVPTKRGGAASRSLKSQYKTATVKEEGGIQIILPKPSEKAPARVVSNPAPVAAQAAAVEPSKDLSGVLVSNRAEAVRAHGRHRPVEEKSSLGIAPLSRAQAQIVRNLGLAVKNPDSPRARLVQFLGRDIQKYVDKAVAKRAPHIPDAQTYVYAHLLRDAVEFFRTTKGFLIGPGGFSAQTIADKHALNARTQATLEKAKAQRGDVSIHDETNTDGEGDGGTVGDIVPSQDVDPAQQAQDLERQAAVMKVMDQVLSELRADYKKSGRDLAFDVVAAEMFGGVTVSKKALPADQRKWVGDAAFQHRIVRDVRNAIARHTGSLDSFKEKLMQRFSRVENGVEVPLSPEEVTNAVVELLGRMPENIRVVSDPDSLTHDGQHWNARVTMGPNGFTIELNAPYIGSPEEVHSVLMHEGVHAVSTLPEVQDAMALVADTVNPDEAPGTTGEERMDEAIAESVTGNWSSKERRSAWRKLVDTIWAAIKRLFGINPPESEVAKDFIAATALQTLKSGTQPNENGESVRYSRVTGQRFRSVKEVARALNTPGLSVNQETDISEAGRAVGRLVSDGNRVAMDALNDPNATDVQKRAFRILRPVREIAQLALLRASPFAGNEDLQARGVLDANQHLTRLNLQWRQKLAGARAEVARAATNMPAARAKDIAALIADSNAKQMVTGYRDYLKAEKKLATVNGSPAAKKLQALNAMETDLGSVLRDQPASIRATLEAIARNMPPGLADEVALAQWLANEEKTGWPAFGGTAPATTKVWTFLVKGDAAAGIPPAIVNTHGLMGRLTDLRTIIDDQAAADATRTRFLAHMTALGAKVRSSVSAEQFAREYTKWVEARKGATDEANAIYDELKRADLKVRSLVTAINHLERTMADPQYRSELSIAANRLNQRTGGIVTFSTVQGNGNQILDGKVNIVGPVSGEKFDFDYDPSAGATARNIANAQKLIGEIAAYTANPDAEPGRVAVYQNRVMPMLQGRFMTDIGSQIIGAADEPAIPIISPHWLMKAPFRVTQTGLDFLSNFFPGVGPRKVIYNLVGGVAGADLLNYLARTDIFHSAIRATEHTPATSSTTQKKLAIRAAQHHGFLPDKAILMGRGGRAASEHILDWDQMVLNPMVARNQNPGGTGLTVGQYTPTGYQITDADVAAFKAQKGYTDGVRRRINASASYATAQLPPQVREQMGGVDDYFRDETNYGMKMARSVSHWGRDIAQRFLEAAKADEQASSGAGFPVYDEQTKLIEDNPKDANLLINGWWGTTNPEYWHGYSDPIQKAVALELSSTPSVRHTFDGLDSFADHFGKRRADIINARAGSNVTTELAQRDEALKRFFADIKSASQKILGTSNGANLPGRDAEGVGSTVTDITSANSSLSQPRGRMVAPDPFYSYTITDEGEKLRFNSQVLLYAQSQELLALRSVLAGLRKELARMDADYARSIPHGTGFKRLMDEYQYRKSKNEEVKTGKAITRRRDLSKIIGILEKTADGIEANMKQAAMNDKAHMQILRGVESSISVAKLFSLTVQYANLVSAGFIAPTANAYALANGKMGIVNSIVQAAGVLPPLFKQFYRAVTDTADALGMGEVFRKNPDALMGIARMIHESALARREQLEYLKNIGFQVPESFGDAASRAMMNLKLPETGGVVARESSLHPVINPVVAFTRLFPGAIMDAMAFAGGQLTAAGEMIGTLTQDEINRKILESLKPEIVRAFRERQRAMPGWDDTSKPLVPFHPTEIGFNSHKGVNELRRFFATAGNLENLFLDWYKRATAGGSINMDEPLLPEQQEAAVRLEMQKAGNIVTDSGKGDALKKKGWAGVGTNILFRFQQYPLMLSYFINDKLSTDPRDASKVNILKDNARAIMLLAVAGALAVAGLAGKQWLQYLQSGKVPAQSTVTTAMENPTAVNIAKMMVAGGANLFMPYWGDAANKLLSGQSQKPGMDLAQIVPGFGAAAQFGQAMTRVAQTRSVAQPMVDLTRQLFPATEAVLNRMPNLREDLVIQNASRSIRSAAPSDIELKEMGGGNARQTPTTPVIRNAIRAAVAGDQGEFNKYVGQAVQMKMDAGADEKSARKSVASSIQGRNPIRLAVGRELTADEEGRMVAQMTGPQQEAYAGAKDAFGRIGTWLGGGTKKTSRPGRGKRPGTGGLFRQSALRRGRRRRRSLGSASRALVR